VASCLRSVAVGSVAGRSDSAKSAAAFNQLLDSLVSQSQGDTRLARSVAFKNEDEDPAQKKLSEDEKERLQAEERAKLAEDLSRIESDVAQASQEIQNCVTLIRQLEARVLEEESKGAVLAQTYRVKKPAFELLADADNNIAQLKERSQVAAQRIYELATEWEAHRKPLFEQYRALKDAQLNKQDETKAKLEKIKEMRTHMKAMVEDIHQKEDHYKQLLEAYESLPKDITRAVYTRRILEIVKNVKKQKVDIDKILIDTRNLKKEINNVTDTLGRVFTVVDELIFQDANVKKDQTAIQAYKQVAAMDENFKKLQKVIEEAGSTKNNILNLEAKIEQIQLRTNSLNVDRLETDLTEIKEENKKLLVKLAVQ